MIYTVTFNLSIDYIVPVNELIVGEINRSSDELVFAGGKGINVSIVLNNLQVDSTALGFVGGFSGNEIVRQLQDMNVHQQFINLSQGITRINVKVKSPTEETAINGSGPNITDDEISRLYAQLDTLIEGDTLVLAGSIPNSLPTDIYQIIMARLSGKGIRIIVDATKDLLTNVLPYKPFLIKPNNEELSEIFEKPLATKEDLINAAKELQAQGAQHVLISLGGDGAILISADGTIYTSPAPKGTLINSVGAGDSMVAGFITGYKQSGGDLQKALYWGIATGSASAFSHNLATKDEVETLLKTIKK